MKFWDYIVIVFVVGFVVVWIMIRNKKSDLIGLEKDRNRQKIDRVKEQPCLSCNKGVLEPKFSWWRYIFAVYLPIGYVAVIGRPKAYKCTNCNKVVDGLQNKGIVTRISLSHHMPIAFVIAQIVFFVTVGLLIGVIGYKIFGF
jgi:hypothetical protein